MIWKLSALLGLMCAGCAPGSDAPEQLPTQQAPPSFAILFGSGSVEAGQTTQLDLQGAPPGATVYVFANQNGPGHGPCAPGGALCLDLTRPAMVARATADASGAATAFLRVPAALPPGLIFMQAATASPAGTGKSSIVIRLPGDADGDLVLDAYDVCPDTPDPFQIDQDEDGWGAACDCDDLDETAYPGGVDTSNDGIDQDCDGLDGNLPVCPLTSPVRCPDGSCQTTVSACGTPCLASAPFQCADGSCAVSWTACNPTCSGVTPVTCADGSCAPDASGCGTACPPAAPFLCPDGSCQTTPSACAQGCPVTAPIRCPDGTCQASASACAASGCPATEPIRCPDGTCAPTLTTCGDVCDPAAPVFCADGSCAVDASACGTSCSPQAPVRCPDGSCATSVGSCPAACPPATPVRCADGACYADATCSVTTCPSATPVRCPSGACAVSVSQCTP